MGQLQNFPIQNQLSDVSEPNRAFDCVPTCIASCLQYLLGKPYDGGAIKDTVYGQGYVGGTAAIQYVTYAREQGVRLYATGGDPQVLITQVHTLLGEEKPSLITIPDPYMPAGSGWTHVEAFHADSPGLLTALDPYGGKDITKTDAEWATLLQGNELWALERVVMLPQGWTDENGALTAPNGVSFVLGFRAYVLPLLLRGAWEADDYPIGPQYYAPKLEASNPDLGDGDQIITRKHMLAYPHHPTGASAHLANTVIEEYTGTELAYTRNQYASIYAAYQALKAQVQPVPPPPPAPDPLVQKYRDRLQAVALQANIVKTDAAKAQQYATLAQQDADQLQQLAISPVV